MSNTNIIKIETKIVKHGNSYAIALPKASIDFGIFDSGEEILLLIDKDTKEVKAVRIADLTASERKKYGTTEICTNFVDSTNWCDYIGQFTD